MINLFALRLYLGNHPHYISRFIIDICRIWLWRLHRQPIVVLTTESGGLGDYVWFRNYYDVIREHYNPKQCRIIVIGMGQWTDFVNAVDRKPNKNHLDIYRAFETPDNPLKIEAFFFRLFKADVYIDFRERYLRNLVKTKKYYSGKGYKETKQFYETANNIVINKWFPLPNRFKHKLPLVPIAAKERRTALEKPYVVVAEKGNTQGALSDEQTTLIVQLILSQGYNVFYNGNRNNLINNLTKKNIVFSQSNIIDGYLYPLTEYFTITSQCVYVVTVNTLIYHLAIQYNKPLVVISVNEYESIDLKATNQIVVFNKELMEAYKEGSLDCYKVNKAIGLKDIDCKSIEIAINQINKQIIHNVGIRNSHNI